MSGIPLRLSLSSEDGSRCEEFYGRIVGYSNRLNTILVPLEFMRWSNVAFGIGEVKKEPSRMIVKTTSPGDVAIEQYMNDHDWEIAGDKRNAAASFMLKVVVGIVLAIGVVITVLSFFILLLSISLLMEKNRGKMHSLLMLGYRLKAVEMPFRMIVVCASLGAWVLALASLILMRGAYLTQIEGLGAEPAQAWLVPLVGLGLTLLVIGCNLLAVKKRAFAAYYK